MVISDHFLILILHSKTSTILDKQHDSILFNKIKSFNCKRLGKYISPLMISINELNLYYTLLNIVSNIVTFDFNVLTCIMSNMFFGKHMAVVLL